MTAIEEPEIVPAEAPVPKKSNDPSHVAKLALGADSDSRRWFPKTSRSLGFMTLALCGEVGEVANIVKKIERGSADLRDAKTRLELQMELADVFTYLLGLSVLAGCDLEKAYHAKRAINEKRFGPRDE